MSSSAKSQVELAILKIQDTDRGPVLRVNGVSDEGLTQVPVTLEAASTSKDDWKQVLQTTTNTDVTLARAQVGGPGLHRIRATFAGDDARSHWELPGPPPR